MKTLRKILKWIAIIFGAYLVLFSGYFYYSLSTAEGRIRPLCAQIKAGTSLSELRAVAVDNGLSMPNRTQDGSTAYMVERRSYGRYGCKITFAADLVKAAEYMHND